ncbi:hypothetical protein M441DRAFT_270782 [Trichoderma asperellum CBS 433.97]|uniref:Uncharacterized protein n=1 Tax=Trichoderma asperellum (strain ATCC 204424 / CBS 433.97 / NBRC 101777) TaxID=1042311 RepID=A0A2T3YWE8_TRIA4|nr:hypothetical protein M441DRAFT_270782 [Trichoderma asperellum CBS 433.97]PTB36860.1 hypothetical protein M441DRAFT_270782 [Trichoderma asperellum CBS 433.97]
MTDGFSCIEYFVMETLLCDMVGNVTYHDCFGLKRLVLGLNWCLICVVTFCFLPSYLHALLLLYSQQYPYMLNAR